MDYLDFTLRIDPRPGVGEVLVVASPAGHGAREPFVSPLSEEDLKRVGEAVERAAERPPRRRLRNLVALGAGRPPDPLIEDVGDRLFRAVFVGAVKDRFLESLERAVAQGRGLRIRLRFALGDPGGSPGVALHRLPWELLFRREAGEFLARRRRTPVVRDLEGAVPPAPPSRSGPLVVLAAMAAPRRCPVLDLDRELRSLERSFEGRAGGVEVRPLPRATLGELAEALRPGGVDVLHFMGHGDLEEETGGGVLYLEDDLGATDPVSGERFSDQLRDFLPEVRLVFLNACRTGEAVGAAPWAGVATALVRAGVGAVVAMQHPVADTTATAFSREVYRRLAAGAPVDEAVADGRLAIDRERPGSPEWSTPVLFLRAADGRLPALEDEGESGQERRKPGRAWPAVAAGLVVAIALAVVVAVLFPVGAPMAPGSEGAPQPTEEREPVAEPARRGAESEGPASREPTPPGPAIRELQAGEPAYLGEARATVTVEFLTLEERTFVGITVSPDDLPVQAHPAFGPRTVAFRWGADQVLVHVLAIDWERRVVRLRASR